MRLKVIKTHDALDILAPTAAIVTIRLHQGGAISYESSTDDWGQFSYMLERARDTAKANLEAE